MKRTIAFFLLILFLPAVASSQTYEWISGFNAIPGVSRIFDGSMYGGISTEIFAGYVGNRRGLTFAFEPAEDSLGGPYGNLEYFGSRMSYSVSGLIAGMSCRKRIGTGLAIALRASCIVPNTVKVLDEYQWTHFVQGARRQSREWNGKTQWWNAEVGADFPLTDAFLMLAGFRYDSLQTHFSDPTSMLNASGNRRGFPSDEADVTINCYIPYVGIRSEFGSANSSVKAGFIGTPWMPGDMDYKNTLVGERRRIRPPLLKRFEAAESFESGYFLEIFGEYAVRIAGFTAGLFGKYNLIHAETAPQKSLNTSGDGLRILDEEPFSFSLYRDLWIVGGNVSMDFSLPL
jgi:hypothetical protein